MQLRSLVNQLAFIIEKQSKCLQRRYRQALLIFSSIGDIDTDLLVSFKQFVLCED